METLSETADLKKDIPETHLGVSPISRSVMMMASRTFCDSGVFRVERSGARVLQVRASFKDNIGEETGVTLSRAENWKLQSLAEFLSTRSPNTIRPKRRISFPSLYC